MTASFDPDQSRFRSENASLASTPQQRSFQLRNHIDKLRAADPSLDYDRAYAQAVASPEMRGVVAAMKTPNATPEPVHTFTTPEQKVAGAKFLGAVKTAAHTRGISFDDAWRAVSAEEPALYAEMGDPFTAAQAKAREWLRGKV